MSFDGDFSDTVRVLDFETETWTSIEANTMVTDLTGGHGGGDQSMMNAFLGALAGQEKDLISTGPDVSLESDLMAFAAEKSRREGRVVSMAEYIPY